ncbi:hypothetical protein ACFX1R_032122 [Malus domestica]
MWFHLFQNPEPLLNYNSLSQNITKLSIPASRLSPSHLSRIHAALTLTTSAHQQPPSAALSRPQPPTSPYPPPPSYATPHRLTASPSLILLGIFSIFPQF